MTASVLCTIDHLELVMPRYAIRGGDVILKCEHSVTLEQLYKVEWRKGENKIFQYIKGRKPPYRLFQMSGSEINKNHSSYKQIMLSKLDFAASGSYCCVVSTETPIFTKDSDSKELTVIEPQERNPEITFNKETYEIGEVLEANCTTAPSKPPPHITWFINEEKAMDKLTKSFSNGLLQGHGFFETKASSTKQLSVEVSELHVGDDGELKLKCVATIPGYVNNNEDYADKREEVVRIDIVMTEGPVEANSQSNISLSSRTYFNFISMLIFFIPSIYN